jgi:hypothetical protein
MISTSVALSVVRSRVYLSVRSPAPRATAEPTRRPPGTRQSVIFRTAAAGSGRQCSPLKHTQRTGVEPVVGEPHPLDVSFDELNIVAADRGCPLARGHFQPGRCSASFKCSRDPGHLDRRWV